MKIFFYKTKQNNNDVTNKYVSIIRNSLIERGNKCYDVDILEKCKNKEDSGAVTIDVFHTIAAKRKGYVPVIYWVQGLCPEESFLRRGSRIRRYILSKIEKKALLSADFILFVSNSMSKHFKNKYKFETNKQYIMPCFSEELDDKLLFEDSHKKNVFLYAGRLSAWQCFEETVQLYKQIEEKFNDTSFLVMTHQQQEAMQVINKYRLKNYNVGYAEPEYFSQAIKNCKFGFCLRKKDVVNHVATPTKFSDYVSNGLITIYSKNTEDFHIKAGNNPFCLCIEDENFWERLGKLCNADIDSKKIYEELKQSFGNYYSSSYHIGKLAESLSALESDFSI